MLKLKTLLTPLAVSIVLVLAAPAIAKKDRGHNRDGMRQILSQLSLTDVQKQDIKQLMRETQQDRKLLKENKFSIRPDLKPLIQSNHWDKSAVETALTQQQLIQSDKMLKKAIQRNRIWNTLTTEQQAEFTRLVSDRKDNVDDKGVANKSRRESHAKMFKKLTLSDAQKSQIDAIRQQMKERNQDLKAKLKEFKQAEREIVNHADFDTEKWLTLTSDYQPKFLAMAVSHAKTRHDIWNVLSIEQQQKIKKKMTNRYNRDKK